MEKKKHKYGVLWLLILVIFLITIACFWGRVFRAKLHLTSALNETITVLEQRFQMDPVFMLMDCYSPEGKYSVDTQMCVNRTLWDSVLYDMTVSVNMRTKQINAVGTASTQAQKMDLSLYLDPSFMAVSVNELALGDYYGITYDTFAADIQKVPFLNFIMNDDLVAQWDHSIQSIKKQMNHAYTLPNISPISKGELKKLLLGITALPCRVQKANILLAGSTVLCDKLEYTVNGECMADVKQNPAGVKSAEEMNAVIGFYLYENQLARITFSGTSNTVPIQFSLDFGMDPAQNPIMFQGSYGGMNCLAATIATQKNSSQYSESWEIRAVSEGKEINQIFDFIWNTENGDLEVKSPSFPTPVFLNLKKGERGGVRLEADDFSSLVGTLSHDMFSLPNITTCTLTISKGAEFNTPSYKNLDQWSVEDFLTLLGGASSLFGLKIA